MKSKKKGKNKVTLLLILLVIIGIFAVLASSKLIRIQVNSETIDGDVVTSNFIDTTQDSKVVNLSEIKNSKQKNVILFTASWCGSCSRLVDDLKADSIIYPNITMYVFDLETYRDTANELNVPITPTLVLLENGKTKNYPEIGINNLPTILSDFNRLGIR